MIKYLVRLCQVEENESTPDQEKYIDPYFGSEYTLYGSKQEAEVEAIRQLKCSLQVHELQADALRDRLRELGALGEEDQREYPPYGEEPPLFAQG